MKDVIDRLLNNTIGVPANSPPRTPVQNAAPVHRRGRLIETTYFKNKRRDADGPIRCALRCSSCGKQAFEYCTICTTDDSTTQGIKAFCGLKSSRRCFEEHTET